MQHEITTVDRARRDLRAREIALEKIYSSDVIEIAPSAGDQTIDNANAVTAPNEFFRKVRSDESGAASNEVMSHASTNLSNIRARRTGGEMIPQNRYPPRY